MVNCYNSACCIKILEWELQHACCAINYAVFCLKIYFFLVSLYHSLVT